MLAVVASLIREVAVQSFAYHAHHVIGRTDSDKSFCRPSLFFVPRQNIKSAMLSQARPLINHLTSYGSFANPDFRQTQASGHARL